MNDAKKRVFISYASEEDIIARKIEDLIRKAFGNLIEVFTSASGIRAGQLWFRRISDEARKTDLLVAICSPFSISKMWLAFEAGAAWSREIDIIPICHSGLTRFQLPDPFRQFHSLEIPSDDFPQELVSAISTQLSIDMPLIDNVSAEKELKLAIHSVEDQVKPFDIFLSTPLATFDDPNKRVVFLTELRDVLGSLFRHQSLRNFHYCLDTIESFSLSQPPFLAADITIQRLRKSKKFLMIVPEESMPSSCFVEAGIAIGLNIPSVYFVRNRKCLPNLLREVRGARGVQISVIEFSNMGEIAKLVDTYGSKLWPNITA